MGSGTGDERQGAEARPHAGEEDDRRAFFQRSSAWVMAGSLAASYGTCGYFALRYLVPADTEDDFAWQYVGRAESMPVGKAVEFVSAAGEHIVVRRHGEAETADSFRALSSVCPHLGCRVFWEANNKRFFCPCHNGTFDPEGRATGGPPYQAGQRLTTYPLRVEDGLVFVRARRKKLGA